MIVVVSQQSVNLYHGQAIISLHLMEHLGNVFAVAVVVTVVVVVDVDVAVAVAVA
jgi:hypothetical protein